ncbi:hypothetical protein PV376_31515 [Streptomyces sp. NRRL_ISP-5395]|uniref:hypothetical protein n=1 Tax=Streptomyces TaxID=1883 RepID=UPI000BEF1EF3|nr:MULTISPECIES: hypothetical protein [Streptomyces]MDX2674041.1 hypothetical protein [Streptomyces sp. NRRL_ISP-5395]GHF70818.1 hypothetical protein GCM10010504_44040 [Streptomyces griseus]
MTEKRSYLDTPGYLAFLTVVAFWAAASSGSPLYVRVLAGVSAACTAVHLAVLMVRRRRDRRTVADGS